MKPYQPSAKIAVRDSLDDDFSDDVEDDVFIRDGKMSRVSNNNNKYNNSKLISLY